MTPPLEQLPTGTSWLPRGLLFFLPILLTSFARAQSTGELVTVTHPDAITEQPLTINAELHQGERVQQAFFLYRVFGRSEFTALEMHLVWNTGSVEIPARDVLPPFIEYYMVLVTRSGSFELYPPGQSEDPFSAPPAGTLRIPVRDAASSAAILFLSPEPNARTSADELLISVSLFRVDTTVSKQATRLFLDTVDVTRSCVLAGDLLIFVPENSGIAIGPGQHTATVQLFDKDGKLRETGSTRFTIRTVGTSPPPAPGFTYRGSAQLESRNEQVAGEGTWYNRATLRMNGTWEDWEVKSHLFITSDENRVRQPQNRYFLGIESSWLELGLGDSYPIFPSLIMSGKRIRGFTGKVQLGPQAFIVATGETDRGIEGALIQSFPAESLLVQQQRDPGAAYGPIGPNATTWGKFSYGTFERDLLVLRSETRPGKNLLFGLTALKGKDEIGSIRFGISPKENLVVGADFSGAFDDRRIEFLAQGAFSAFNLDISSGTFTDEYIDNTFGSSASDVKDLKNILDGFITVNDNLRPLSLKELSTLAYEFSLGLKYLRNALKLGYIYRGSDYTSFGQTYIRTDIQGVTASDRIALSDNQVLLSLGFEHLQDNTSNFKLATTTFSNYDIALSYFPTTKAPSVTVGFGRYSSDNGLPLAGPDSLNAIDDVTKRFLLQSAYNFELGISHTASLSVSNSQRDDRSVRGLDVDNTTITTSILSRYGIPLQTTFDLLFSFNALPSSSGPTAQDLDYTTLALSGRYRVWQGRMDLEGRVSPTFGDYKRLVWEAGTAFRIIPQMGLQLRFIYFDNDGTKDDSIWALTYRYDL
jgi:hypothetical protein